MVTPMMRLHGKRGFSLAELLAAVAVLAALVLLTVQAMSRTTIEAKKVGCVQNLRQIGAALLAYAADHQQLFPFQASAEPHFTPQILGTALVGDRGKAGYLGWNGNMKTRYWSDAMLCPGDPNRTLYENRTSDNVPVSYMYRQNAQAGKGTTDKPSIRLSLLTRPNNQEGYRRWIVSDRNVLGPTGIVKPYPGASLQLRGTNAPTTWSDRDTSSRQSYWHPGGCTVLYEDGSAIFRRYPDEPVGR